MAQIKPVIKSIEEATCETCIYGVGATDTSKWCVKPGTDYAHDGFTMMENYQLCGQGQWLVYMGGHNGMNQKPDCAGLDEVYEWFTE